jgi:hypothetical protein
MNKAPDRSISLANRYRDACVADGEGWAFLKNESCPKCPHIPKPKKG